MSLGYGEFIIILIQISRYFALYLYCVFLMYDQKIDSFFFYHNSNLLSDLSSITSFSKSITNNSLNKSRNFTFTNLKQIDINSVF